MFQLLFVLLAAIGASIHLVVWRRRESGAVAADLYLLYLLVIYVGVMGLVTFVFHVFFPARASASIGWSPSPFEYEVGIADFTIGMLGVLCLWFRGEFWLATAIANFLWLEGDAIGHIRQLVLHGNHAQNNSGIFLYAEIVMPIVVLFLALRRYRKSGL